MLTLKRMGSILRPWMILLMGLGWQATLLAAEAPDTETDNTGSDAAAVMQDAELSALLVQLTDASLRETVELLPQLESAGGMQLLGMFEVMLEGDLYYEEDTRQLLRIYEDSSTGDDVIADVFSGDVLTDSIAEDNTKKIRVNNRLRGMLRLSIARINLTEGGPAQRRAAAVAMLDDIDEDSAALLAEALNSEADEDVRAVMQVGIAMYELTESGDEAVQLAAIETLKDSLESPVRNLLASFREGGRLADSPPAVVKAADQALKKIEGRIDFFLLLEQMFFGLSLGSVLLLAAIGLAVTFGVMGVINMAHGEMLMLGAYTTYVVQLLMPQAIEYSIWVAIPAAFLVSGLVGMFIQRFVIRYLNGRPLETLLATFGISLILQQTVRSIFSPLNRRVISPEWMSGSLEINPVLSLTWNRLYILLFALIVFALLVLILKKTSLGLNVRAVSQNRAMAKAMGVRTDIVDAMTFGLGSGIAGMAGVALSQLTNVGPNLGQGYIIDSFMVVVFGGVGNLMGTLLAAFSLGTVNKFLEPEVGAVLANILILVFIILFIQKRPKGLFPQKGRAAE